MTMMRMMTMMMMMMKNMMMKNIMMMMMMVVVVVVVEVEVVVIPFGWGTTASANFCGNIRGPGLFAWGTLLAHSPVDTACLFDLAIGDATCCYLPASPWCLDDSTTG